MTTAAGRMAALARAELTLLGRSKATLAAAVFMPLLLPFSLRSTVDQMDLKGTGLSVGSVVLPSSVGFSLLFAVYSSLVSVYAARREELVLKRLRTGELRDMEILAGAALPSVAIGLVQCLVLTVACAALLDVGAPHLAVLGLLLGLAMWPPLAAITANFSKSVEGAQVATMPLMLVSLFGSGTFFPLQVMPDQLASACELLPLTPVITLIRGGWTGGLSAHDTLGALGTAVAWIVLAVFAVRRWFRWEPRR
jgi:ABC-2 type transport system permease protein